MVHRRQRKCARAVVCALALTTGLALLVSSPGASAQPGEGEGAGRVLATRVDDAITPIIADHLDGVVVRAEDGGYEALIVTLDTPGGLDTAMRDIVQTFLAAEVPVVVHVSPSGARAASAGALIAWSANVVAMAPGTTIGAATPVSLEGGDEVGDKIVNDAAAYSRAVAEERGRNVEVAEEVVTEGRALSDGEAVAEDAADLVVGGQEALLDALDGREVVLADGATVTLQTAGAEVDETDMSFLRRLLQWLADPNLAFLFMSVGTLGIIYELATPGVGVGGGIGVLLILLALVSLAILPVDAVGFVFLVLALALFTAELFAPGIGVAAALGAVSLALSGVFLFRDDTPGLNLDLAAVIPTVAVVGVAVVVAGRLALRARHAPAYGGPGDLVGRRITVASATGGAARAEVDGTWWTVRSDEDLRPGERVRVREIDGLDLVVEHDTSAHEGTST